MEQMSLFLVKATAFASRHDQTAGSSVISPIVIASSDSPPHDAGLQITKVLSKKRVLEIEDSDSEENVKSTCSAAKRTCREWKQELTTILAPEYHSIQKEEATIKGEFDAERHLTVKDDTVVKEEPTLKKDSPIKEDPMLKREALTDHATISSRATSENSSVATSKVRSSNIDTATFAASPSPIAPSTDIESDVTSTLLSQLEHSTLVEVLKREIEDRDIAIELYFAEIDRLTMERIRMDREVKVIERTERNACEILQSSRDCTEGFK